MPHSIHWKSQRRSAASRSPQFTPSPGAQVCHPGRGDLDLRLDLMMEAQILVDIGCGSLAAAMARITVAGPVTQSPPANTPSKSGRRVLESASRVPPRWIWMPLCSKPWDSMPCPMATMMISAGIRRGSTDAVPGRGTALPVHFPG